MTAPEPLSDDYLEQWSRDRQHAAYTHHVTAPDKCPRCNHVFHGVRCSFTEIYVHCTCPSSWEVGE